MIAAMKDGTFKYDGTNTVKSAQIAFYAGVAHMAGEGQLKGMKATTQIYDTLPTADGQLGSDFASANYKG